MSEGERVIRGTRRPDGTYRKDLKVRAGYVPQDEQPVYVPRGAQVCDFATLALITDSSTSMVFILINLGPTCRPSWVLQRYQALLKKVSLTRR